MATVNLQQIAAGVNTFANAQGAVVYQAADPQGGYGCNENCTLPVTPNATPIKPSLNAVTCKAIFNITGLTGSTGVTGSTFVLGLNQSSSHTAILYEEEIECGDDIDFTLFPIITRTAGADAAPGVNHLAKFNQLDIPWIGGNVQIRVTGLTDADVDAQLAEPIQVISMDINNNLAVCMVSLNANECSVCVNPTSSTNNIATYSPNCPLFFDSTHGIAVKILPGTTSFKVTVCILAAEVVNNYTACGA